MARAHLHYALVLDREIHEASKVDATLLDPIVRVEGTVPGDAEPFRVIREYQGPQGAYTEHFVVRNALGEERYRSRTQPIRLTGEAFEDRFVSTVEDVRFLDGEEHRAVFFVDGDEVGDIPVFLETGLGGDPYVAQEKTVTTALQKGSILWLEVPQPDRRRRFRRVEGGTHSQAVWYVLEDGKVYVLAGETEQQVPGLAEAEDVTLSVRSKETRSRIAQVPATVSRVPSDDERFASIGAKALSERLNLRDGERALERWRSHCTLYELTPRWRPAGTLDPSEVAARQEQAEAEAAPQLPNESDPGTAVPKEEIHVEAQVDQEVYDKLISEGKSERVARAKAKSAYVRAEKARIRAEREADGGAEEAEQEQEPAAAG